MVKYHLKKLNTSKEVFTCHSDYGEGNHGSASTMLFGSLSTLTVSTTMCSSFDSIGNEAVADKAAFLTMHHPTAPAATRNEAVADEAELEAEFTTMNRPAATASYGRPKGTTNTSTHDFRNRVKLATKEASQEYKRVRDMLKAANQGAPRGSHTIILDLAKAKYNVESANISQATFAQEQGETILILFVEVVLHRQCFLLNHTSWSLFVNSEGCDVQSTSKLAFSCWLTLSSPEHLTKLK